MFKHTVTAWEPPIRARWLHISSALQLRKRRLPSAPHRERWKDSQSWKIDEFLRNTQLTKCAYDQAIEKCRSSRDWTSYRALLHRASSIPGKPISSIRDYNILVRKLCDDGMLDDALEVIKTMHDSSSGSISGSAHLPSNDTGTEHINTPEPDNRTYGNILNACSKMRLSQKSLEIMETMEENKVEIDMFNYNSILAACARDKRCDVEQISRIVEKMYSAGFEPDAISISSIITALVSVGREKEATHWFHKVEVIIQDGIKHGFTSHKVIGAVTNACAKMGQWHSAISVLSQCQSKHNFNNLTTSTGANLEQVPSYSRTNHLHQFLSRPRIQQYRVNRIIFHNVLSACSHAGQWNVACRLFQRMESDFGLVPDCTTYSLMMGTYGAWRKNNRLFVDKNEHNNNPDEKHYDVSAQSISSTSSSSSASPIWDLLEDMESRHITLDQRTYSAALRACSMYGDYRTVQHLLIEMQRHGYYPNRYAILSALSACSNAIKYPGSLMDDENKLIYDSSYKAPHYQVITTAEWIWDLLTAENIPYEPDISLYNALLTVYARDGDYKSALRILTNEMPMNSITPDMISFTCLIHAKARSGYQRDGSVLLSEVESLLDQHQQDSDRQYHELSNNIDSKPSLANIQTLNAAIAACARPAPKRKRAVHETNSCLGQNLQNSHGHGGHKDNDPVFQDTNLGNVALSILKSMNTDTINAHSFTACIKALSSSGQWSEALSLFEVMQTNYAISPTKETFLAAIGACAKEGEFIHALQLLQSFQSQEQFEPSVWTVAYTDVINSCRTKQLWQDALAVFAEMRDRDIKASRVTFHCLLTVLRDSHRRKEAEDIFYRMQSIHGIKPDVESYNIMIHILAQSRDSDAAIRACTEAIEEGHFSHHRPKQDDLNRDLPTIDLHYMPKPTASALLHHFMNALQQRYHSSQLIQGTHLHNSDNQDDYITDSTLSSLLTNGLIVVTGAGNNILAPHVANVFRNEFSPALTVGNLADNYRENQQNENADMNENIENTNSSNTSAWFISGDQLTDWCKDGEATPFETLFVE